MSANMLQSSVRVMKTGADAWKSLNGVFCFYKPSGIPVKHCREEIKQKLSADLCSMHHDHVEKVVEIRRSPLDSPVELEFGKRTVKTIQDGNDLIQVLEGPSYTDNPLVIGPRYQPEDIKLLCSAHLGRNTSGVVICGVNSGTNTSFKIRNGRWLRSYIISGKFGIATNTYFHLGKVGGKATFKSIKRHMVDRLLSSLQSTHQQLAFETVGVPNNSQRAYELASSGIVRPAENSEPVLYSLKCIHFDLPNFDIEVHAINETEEYLTSIIHDIGIKLHSFAVCTKLRCIKHGPFTVEDTLLKKHWNLQNILENMESSSQKLKNVNLRQREKLITKEF